MPSLDQDVDVIEAAATARTYTVVAGDTLTRIAARTGVSVSDLVAFNQLADPDRIEVGQILRLDAATQPEPSDTSAAARFHWGDPIREWSDPFISCILASFPAFDACTKSPASSTAAASRLSQCRPCLLAASRTSHEPDQHNEYDKCSTTYKYGVDTDD